MAAEAETLLVAQLEVPSNDPVNDPVKDPVLICSELDTKPLGLFVIVAQSGVPTFNAYDAVRAYDADVALLILPLYDPVKLVAITDPVTVNPDGNDTNPSNACAYEAVSAYDADCMDPNSTLAVDA